MGQAQLTIVSDSSTKNFLSTKKSLFNQGKWTVHRHITFVVFMPYYFSAVAKATSVLLFGLI